MTDRSLLIVRGGRNGSDSTFSCVAHSTDPGNYVAIEFENGLVASRTLYRGAERKTLEKLATSPTFTSVYADTRTGKHLLPFKFPKHALEADLNVFRRAKSDDEISSIQRMSGILQASRELARDEQHFRGTVDSLEYRHAMQETTGKEFSMKRYGLQDALGRTVELTSVSPHTVDWRTRMLRVDNGCYAVQKQLREGASGSEIDKTFRSYLDPNSDVLYGNVLHHTGYEPWETDLTVDVLNKYDVLSVCPVIGDKRGNSIPYMHSVHAITDAPFRGVTSYDTLFRDSSVVPTYRASMSQRDTQSVSARFLENVKNIMKLWKALIAGEPDDDRTHVGQNVVEMLSGDGANEFITDFARVVQHEQYTTMAGILSTALPAVYLKEEGWKRMFDKLYGTELSPEFMELIRRLFIRLLQISAEWQTVKARMSGATQMSYLVLAIAFVAFPLTLGVDFTPTSARVLTKNAPRKIVTPKGTSSYTRVWALILVDVYNDTIHPYLEDITDSNVLNLKTQFFQHQTDMLPLESFDLDVDMVVEAEAPVPPVVVPPVGDEGSNSPPSQPSIFLNPMDVLSSALESVASKLGFVEEHKDQLSDDQLSDNLDGAERELSTLRLDKQELVQQKEELQELVRELRKDLANSRSPAPVGLPPASVNQQVSKDPLFSLGGFPEGMRRRH